MDQVCQQLLYNIQYFSKKPNKINIESRNVLLSTLLVVLLLVYSLGKIAVSAVTSTELGYLSGVTSNIQTQLSSKAATHNHPYLSNTIDHVVAQGSSGIWYYRKWNSGRAECYGITVQQLTINNSWGNLYESGIFGNYSYPFSFTTGPSEVAMVVGDNGSMLETHTRPSVTKSSAFYIVRPNTASASNYTISVYTFGKWK